MQAILDLLWTCLELAFLRLCTKAFLPDRRTRAQRWIACGLWTLAGFASVHLCPWPWLTLGLCLLLSLALSLYLHRGPILAHVLISLLCIAVSNIFVIGALNCACALLDVSPALLIRRPAAYAAAGTAGELLALLLGWLLLKLQRIGPKPRPRPLWLLLILLFPALNLACVLMTFLSYRSASGLFAGFFSLSVGLAAANCALLSLLQRRERLAREAQEIALLNRQLAIQTDSITALEQSYRAQRKANHDFRNHIGTLQRLLAQGDLKALEEYLSTLQNTQPPRILYMDSHHSIIDAVMNPKCQAAIDADIDILVEVNDLSELKLPTDLLVVLLSNLMDNAIEGCLRYGGEQFIRCKLLLESSSFFLSVVNSSLPVTVVNNTVETSKSPARDHGYGLPGSLRILERLQAEYTFGYTDGTFRFHAEIPL